MRRNGAAPSNFDRVEPSRSRDAAFESFGKGKGDGFGGKGDAFGKGNWVEISARLSMLHIMRYIYIMHLFIHLFISLFIFYLFIYFFIDLLIHVSIYLFMYFFISLFIYFLKLFLDV